MGSTLLRADNVAAKNIDKHVQVKILSLDRAGQIRDVPGVDLIDHGGLERKRLVALLGRALAAPVGVLMLAAQ